MNIIFANTDITIYLYSLSVRHCCPQPQKDAEKAVVNAGVSHRHGVCSFCRSLRVYASAQFRWLKVSHSVNWLESQLIVNCAHVPEAVQTSYAGRGPQAGVPGNSVGSSV